MAKAKRVTGVNVGSVAAFEGVFAGVLGLGVAILYSLRTTVEIADQTDSVLSGLVFGLDAGIVSLIVVPLIYFALGYVVGFVHAHVFNMVASSSGGLVIHLED